MQKPLLSLSIVALLGLSVWGPPAVAQQEPPEWISEPQLNQLTQIARQNGYFLEKLSCRFQDVDNPGREHVQFKPQFARSQTPIPWGWTFSANAPNQQAETQAKAAGFSVLSEDYYEVSGVTWVRCRIWGIQ